MRACLHPNPSFCFSFAVLLLLSGATAQFCEKPFRAAMEGEECGRSSQCINSDLKMDDAMEGVDEPRAGYEHGLYCRVEDGRITGRCSKRLEDGQECSGSEQCKSRRCGYLNAEARVVEKKTCIGDLSIPEGHLCESQANVGDITPHENRACAGLLCWPEKSASLSEQNPRRTCTRRGEVGEPCEMLWAGFGENAVVTEDTCNPDGSGSRFTTRLTWCKPNNADWRPASSSVRIEDITLSGVCAEVEERKDSEPCAAYGRTTITPNCGWESECLDFGETQGWQCRDVSGEGEECILLNYTTTESIKIGVPPGYGCEYKRTCNFLNPDDRQPGECKKRFSLKEGEAASTPELCKLQQDVLVYWQPPGAGTVGQCKQMNRKSCSSDVDCLPPDNGVPLIPAFCDVSGLCLPLVPDECHEEFELWRNWVLENGRQKAPLSIRVREKRDSSIVEDLLCCVTSNAEGCMRDQEDLIWFGPLSGSTTLPSLFSVVQRVNTLDQGAVICKHSGVGIHVYILIGILGALLLGVLILILVTEYVMPPPPVSPKPPSTSLSTLVDSGEVAEPFPAPGDTPEASKEAATTGNGGGTDNGHTYTPRGGEAEPSAVPYEEGAEVMVYYDGGQDDFHGDFPARIISYNHNDDTYAVRFDTNELSNGVASSCVRRRTKAEEMEKESDEQPSPR